MAKFVLALNESPIIVSQTERANAIVQSDADGFISSFLPPWEWISIATALTTTSTTDVVAPGMSVVPSKPGYYDIIFTGSAGNATSAATTIMSIYVNGRQLVTSKVTGQINSTNARQPFTCVGSVYVAANEAIEGRWSVGSGTGTILQRSLMYKRAG